MGEGGGEEEGGEEEAHLGETISQALGAGLTHFE